ncbi:HAD family hydrolase [Noviherbaspirillum saxi]|uniref:HAD family hydrolase n=1 Tax=Noviherbaspirillum saxi TaxID=2320863 RepID=A0A3A3FPP6_9BURK|nr:HAD family hydrolase [Noviherbaspirillum saxi]RJF97853.1 HAD family hydrolase [Noviherbaspirillum saxi]
MSTIKAVLFDLDDTLWPIVPVIKRAENLLFEWLRTHVPSVADRVSIDGMRARRQALMDSDPVYQLDLRALRHAVLIEAFTAAGEDPGMVDQAMHVFSRARNEVPLFADVAPSLTSLRHRYALASVSNGVSDLHAIGIAHLFDATVAAHSFGCAKPDAAIFHAACEALKVEPQEAIYVGDDPWLDVDGAQKAGLRAAWMNRRELEPVRTLPDGVTPDAICADLFELEDWLRNNQ